MLLVIRLKKILIIFLSIVLLTGCNLKKDSNIDKLKKIGYNENTSLYINNNLNEETINYLLTHKYISSLEQIIKNKNFKEEKLDKYIEYLNKYNFNINDLIFIVNNNYYRDSYNEKIINLMKEDYFIFDNLDRYLNYTKKNNIKDIIRDVNSNIDYNFYTNIKNTDLSKEYLMIVNKFNKLDKNYVPDNLVTIDKKYGNQLQIEKKTYEQFIKMYNDALNQNMHLYIRSPYRSYNTQENLYNNYIKTNSKEYADKIAARAGFSEHQTGLAIDLTTPQAYLSKFENTKEFLWMKKNAYKYGFILRYPKDKEYLTGYMYESWHYRYVGVEAATIIYEKDLTFEEYYAYYVK